MLRMFLNQSINQINIKGYRKPSSRKNQKERAKPTFWAKRLLTMPSQTLLNVTETAQTVGHEDLRLTWRNRQFFLHTLHLSCFSAEPYSETLQISKMECFYVTS